MTYFILIRHGDTLWTKQKRYQGATDTSLSLEGKKKMRVLTKVLRATNVDVICTSSLKRSKESGEMIAHAMNKKIIEDPRLNEVSFGKWEGKMSEELLNDSTYQEWMKGRWITPSGGESLYSLKKRIKGFLKDCLKQYRDKKIIIVSHGGPIRMILLEALKLPIKYMFYFQLDPASVTVLKHYTDLAQLECLNNIFSKNGMPISWIRKK